MHLVFLYKTLTSDQLFPVNKKVILFNILTWWQFIFLIQNLLLFGMTLLTDGVVEGADISKMAYHLGCRPQNLGTDGQMMRAGVRESTVDA